MAANVASVGGDVGLEAGEEVGEAGDVVVGQAGAQPPVVLDGRTTHVFVHGADGSWKLAGLHVGMLGGPPPFAR